MLRKLTIALAATAALGAAALVPTAASAFPHKGHHGHHGHYGHYGWRSGIGIGFYAPVYAGADCYVVKRRVQTPVGPRWRRVTVCD